MAGVEITALLAETVGTPIAVEIEEGLGNDNHSIVKLSDALAVYELLATLGGDGNLDAKAVIDKYSKIFKYVAKYDGADESLESIVYRLHQILDSQSSKKLTVNDRNELYDTITLLTSKGSYTIETDLKDINSNAQKEDEKGLALRYALQQLNPFVLVGRAMAKY